MIGSQYEEITDSGRWTQKTLLSETNSVGLKVRWKKEIGSGYSSVVVADGKAITMYTDGKQDKVICLDAKTGKPLWNQNLEPIFKGSNGSFDGPIATPVINDNLVYCLSARGKLFAFELNSGKRNWVRDLVKEEEAVQPMYGFSTTPLVHGDTLCILAGTSKGVLIGLDTKTGATKWRAGKGRISSQIPAVVNIDGKDIVVTGAGKNVIGVNPKNGKLLFEFAHRGMNGSAMMPVPFGNNRLLFTNDDSFSKAFQLKPAESGYDASEIWSDRSIKNTYNVPVNVDGHFYAYSTRILTCVDQKTGKPKWKSRKPGDGFLIEVDGHLVIVTKKGSVHVAKINTDKYEEIASAKVFENLVWAIPAYSDNAIYVRSLKEIACVEFENRKDSLVGKEKQLQVGGDFGNLYLEVIKSNNKNDRQKSVERFLEKNPNSPYVSDGIAHFFFVGEADDVALACDVFGARQEKKMTRLGDTNLFYHTMKLEPDQRISYIFLKDYKPIVDPRNARKMTSSMYAGEMEFAIRLQNEKPLEMSWFGMSKWKRPDWMMRHRKERLAGKVVKEDIKIDDDKSISASIYLPPEYEKATEKRFPVIYVHEGGQALKLGEMDETADLYFQAKPEKAAILVFLSSPGRATPLPVYMNRVAKTIVPFVDKKYRTKTERENRASFGVGFASGFAMGLAAQHSDLFGACSIQSPLVFDQARKMSIDGFGKLKKNTRLYLEWGRFDMHNPVENWDIREMAKTMKNEIGKNPKVKILGGQVNDSTDWSSWKNRFGRIVEQLFGA